MVVHMVLHMVTILISKVEKNTLFAYFRLILKCAYKMSRIAMNVVHIVMLERCWSWSGRPRPTTLQLFLSNGKSRGF